MRASRFGCFLMLIRQAHERLAQCAHGLEQAATTSRIKIRGGLRAAAVMVVMAFIFIAVLLAGVPVFIALAGASFIYTHFIAGLPDFVILHRMAGGID